MMMTMIMMRMDGTHEVEMEPTFDYHMELHIKLKVFRSFSDG